MKKTLLIAGLSLIMGLSTIHAQSFCSVIGGTGTEFAYDVFATSDGGFILTGTTDSYGQGSQDLYVIKFDASGNSQWTRTVGSFGNDAGNGITVATDGDYIIAGESNSMGAGGEAYVVRLSSTGTLLWTRSIGGSGSDGAREVYATSDNGCVIAGQTDSYGQGNLDAYVAKLDSNGTVEWSKAIGATNSEGSYGICVGSDGNMVIAGRGFPLAGAAQIFIAKIDMSGNILWDKYFASHDVNDFFVPSDIVESGSGYVISGYCDTVAGSNKNSFLTKVSNSGVHQWTRIIGVAGNDHGYSMEKTSDGGFVISGISYGATASAIVIKTDSMGAPAWYSKSSTAGNCYSYGVVQLNNGTFISVGNTDAIDGSDIYITQLDPTGVSCCFTQIAQSNGMLVRNTGNYGLVAAGGVSDTGGVASSGGTVFGLCTSPFSIDNSGMDMIKVFPNPTSGEINLSGIEGFDHIAITNSLGQVIYEKDTNTAEIKISLSAQAAGLYTINLRSKERLVTRKLLIQ